MFNTTIIEITIGLVLVYFLLSLLLTILNEIIASLIGLRADMLYKAIRKMLGNNTQLTDLFYKNSIVKSLSEKYRWQKLRPSYINSSTFSMVLLKILDLKGTEIAFSPDENDVAITGKKVTEKQTNEIAQAEKNLENSIQSLKARLALDDDSDLIDALKTLVVACQNEPERFPAKIEEWYNDTMERVSGWYGRQMKFISLLIGFILAILLNADTFAIVKKLNSDPKARKEAFEMAKAIGQNEEIKISLRKRTAFDSLMNEKKKGIKLPAGTMELTKQDSFNIKTQQKIDTLMIEMTSLIENNITDTKQVMGMGWSSFEFDWAYLREWPFWMRLFGWIVTAVALTLGAPFWFDLMNRLISIRGAGAKPSGKTESASLTPSPNSGK